MKRLLVILTILTILTACNGSPEPDRAMCKEQLSADLLAALEETPQRTGKLPTPAACEGFSDDDMQSISKEVLAENIDEILDNAVG